MMNTTKKQVALIGYPIAHSLSPAMQNAAFAEVGLDWTYKLLPTKEDEFEATLESLSAQNVVGGNITMPHKQAVIPHLSSISDDARIMGAVNTFRIEDGEIHGYNTDGIGFVNALKAARHDLSGMRVVILGAGGAARSAIYSLADAGAAQIVVVNRTVSHGVKLTDAMSAAFPGCDIGFRPLSSETLSNVSIEQVDLLVNATPVGMEPDENESLWPADLPFPETAICYDVIYKPVKTLFLKQAEAAGHPTLNGIGMLVHQGVVGFEIWTGKKVSVETMTQACIKALDGTSH